MLITSNKQQWSTAMTEIPKQANVGCVHTICNGTTRSNKSREI